jgi:hypothetical protein
LYMSGYKNITCMLKILDTMYKQIIDAWLNE